MMMTKERSAARVVSVAASADGLRVDTIPADGGNLAGAGTECRRDGVPDGTTRTDGGAVVYRVLVDGDDFDPFCPSAAFCDLADAEHQAACMTEVDGIEPERIEIVKEAARW